MGLLTDFARVTRRNRCPVCERPDWCLVSRDDPPSRVICARTGSNTRWGEAGWLHKLRAGRRSSHVRTVNVATGPRRADLGTIAAGFQELVEPDDLHGFAQGLCLPAESLLRLGIGQVPEERLSDVDIRWAPRAWSFPMQNERREVVGIRLRLPSGKKLGVKGSKQGLFVPSDLPDELDQLFIAEGETDTAALLALGFDAIGRPGCRVAAQHAVRFVQRTRPTAVVVVADADRPGRAGAAELATRLRSTCCSVRVVAPPAAAGDMRNWVRGGARRRDVQRAVDRVEPLGIRVVRRAR